MRSHKHGYKTEAQLCKDFIQWAKPQGWIAYPETAGWDLVLVGVDGCQIGIQAKLHPNVKVLAQTVVACDFTWTDTPIQGPDFRAVLVPKATPEFEDIARFAGITVFSAWERYDGRKDFKPEIDGTFTLGEDNRWPAEQRIALPKHIPDVVAGSPSPLQLTDWKMKALRITAMLEVRGWVTREDFKKLNLSWQRWPVNRWLKCLHLSKRYGRGDRLAFDKQHPTVFAEIKKEVEAELASEAA